MKSRRPYWTVATAKGSLTVYPSLWRPGGTCESHFWIRFSGIEWV